MEFCYALVPLAPKGKRIGVVQFGESGYFATNLDTFEDEEECEKAIYVLNELMSVPVEVADSAIAGSMFGWHVKGAQLAVRFFTANSQEQVKAGDVRLEPLENA